MWGLVLKFGTAVLSGLGVGEILDVFKDGNTPPETGLQSLQKTLVFVFVFVLLIGGGLLTYFIMQKIKNKARSAR